MKWSSSTWLHKFSKTGQQALSNEFMRQGLTTVEEKAEFVAALLGDAEDMSSTNRPFIWKSTYEDSKTRKLYVHHISILFLFKLIWYLSRAFFKAVSLHRHSWSTSCLLRSFLRNIVQTITLLVLSLLQFKRLSLSPCFIHDHNSNTPLGSSSTSVLHNWGIQTT